METRTFTLFSELRISSILEVLKLFHWKAELWGSSGFQCTHQIKPAVLLSIEIIPEFLKNMETRTFTPFLRTQSSFTLKKCWNYSNQKKNLGVYLIGHWKPKLPQSNVRTFKSEGILSSEKMCESSGFHISLSSGIITLE